VYLWTRKFQRIFEQFKNSNKDLNNEPLNYVLLCVFSFLCNFAKIIPIKACQCVALYRPPLKWYWVDQTKRRPMKDNSKEKLCVNQARKRYKSMPQVRINDHIKWVNERIKYEI